MERRKRMGAKKTHGDRTTVNGVLTWKKVVKAFKEKTNQQMSIDQARRLDRSAKRKMLAELIEWAREHYPSLLHKGILDERED